MKSKNLETFNKKKWETREIGKNICRPNKVVFSGLNWLIIHNSLKSFNNCFLLCNIHNHLIQEINNRIMTRELTKIKTRNHIIIIKNNTIKDRIHKFNNKDFRRICQWLNQTCKWLNKTCNNNQNYLFSKLMFNQLCSYYHQYKRETHTWKNMLVNSSMTTSKWLQDQLKLQRSPVCLLNCQYYKSKSTSKALKSFKWELKKQTVCCWLNHRQSYKNEYAFNEIVTLNPID